ncbi:hypothetical protein C922_05776 [Plasmodium inui San Antonio 1]|uniref:Uncharacterized protein n=1 Tax=Plasmodium inui San Antonio 1 TaxID=1237626 RepID=W7A425_9APIC|nr:hypothetical protein C922_05776 [Plasmodium inui San Antonio 1]EUD63844.1 hypothetical protein C922_05776 [Plasmodium inui San Antonio 1]
MNKNDNPKQSKLSLTTAPNHNSNSSFIPPNLKVLSYISITQLAVRLIIERARNPTIINIRPNKNSNHIILDEISRRAPNQKHRSLSPKINPLEHGLKGRIKSLSKSSWDKNTIKSMRVQSSEIELSISRTIIPDRIDLSPLKQKRIQESSIKQQSDFTPTG